MKNLWNPKNLKAKAWVAFELQAGFAGGEAGFALSEFFGTDFN